MVNLPPPQEPNDRQPPSGSLRDRDEAIAVAIAFLSIGTILWWGWTRGQRFFNPAVDFAETIDRIAAEEERETEALEGDEGDTFLPFVPEREASGNARDPVPTEPETDSPRLRGLEGSLNRERPEADRMDTVPTDPLNDSGAIETPEDLVPVVPPTTAEATETDPDASPSETGTPPPLDISDVSEDYWAYPYIVSLYERGLLPDLPTGQLQPDKELTRAEFAALLNSSFLNEQPTQRELAFADIQSDYWAANAIDQVVGTGYMSGYPDDTFGPSQLVPRYQVLVTFATGLGLQPPSDVDGTIEQFQGAQDLPNWARPKVAAAIANGLVVNHPEPQQLEPQQPATRAEIIALIHQALVSKGMVEPVENPAPFVNPTE